MHALSVFVGVVAVCVLGLVWSMHCSKKVELRMREKELDELARGNPAYYRPLRNYEDEARRVQAIIAHNENLISNNTVANCSQITHKVAQRFICHPSILCHYTTEKFPIPNIVHGARHAVWRETMDRPLCPACMVELVY